MIKTQPPMLSMLILTTLCSFFFIAIEEREGYYDSYTLDLFGLLNCPDLCYCLSFSEITFESFFLNIFSTSVQGDRESEQCIGYKHDFKAEIENNSLKKLFSEEPVNKLSTSIFF